MEVDISKDDMCMLITLVAVCGNLSGQGESFKRIKKQLEISIGMEE